MLKLLAEALRSARRDRRPVPGAAPRRRGKVEIDFARCRLSGACAAACPTPALRLEDDARAARATLRLDLGHCVFCGLCEEACGEGAIHLGALLDLATANRHDLVSLGLFGAGPEDGPAAAATAAATPADPPADPAAPAGARSLDRAARRLLGRSLHVRHVDVGSCSGCEIELEAACGPVHRLAGLGIELVTSPRHADLLLVTGTVTRGSGALLREAHAALPEPRLVVAAGTCAVSGGIHAPGYATLGGADVELPVDVWVPGCPPRPQALVHALLLAVDRAESAAKAGLWRGAYPRAEPAAST